MGLEFFNTHADDMDNGIDCSLSSLTHQAVWGCHMLEGTNDTQRDTSTALRGGAERNLCGSTRSCPWLEQSQANKIYRLGGEWIWNSSGEEELGVLEGENVDKSQKCAMAP